MTYRDDREALLHRVEALERELAQAREESQAAQTKLLRLVAKQAAAERAVEEEAAAEQAHVPAPPLALVAVESQREKSSLHPFMAAATVAAGWTLIAAAVGAAVWMLPAVVISAAVAARLAGSGDHVQVVLGELEKRWPSLRIDHDTYRDLLALPRRTVVVRVAVAFEKQPSRGDREKIKQRVRALGSATWDQATMTIASGTLRTGKGKGDTWAFDPEVLRQYCARVFDALVGVHAEHPIEQVWPRARSR
ncbi:MAG: hypothetical protein SFX73_37300 [Kofleriaceae bacterium]|nr:hypothetical protein [Kofleriaceae bacterium]